MPQTDTPARKFLNPDDVDVSTLNCDEFVEWLNAKQFSAENCEAFRGTYTRIHIIRTCNNQYVNLPMSIAIAKHLTNSKD